MVTDTNLQFICKKIADLQTAIMYSMSNSLVKLPNDVVRFIKIDEEGQLWFLSHLPCQHLKECEQVFPARLHFFKKGCNFFVEVSGKATIVSKIFSSKSFGQENNISKKAVLIKMTMSNVEYTEPESYKHRIKWQELAQKTYSWVVRNIAFQHHQTSLSGKLHNRE